jgi:hypothetical protein
MRPEFLVVPLVGVALCAPAAGQAPDAKSDAAGNAAMKYWQAFGLLPNLTMEQEKIVREWDKAPLDAAALKLIEQARNSLQYLHRAARLPRCDWALDYEDGISLLIPHLSKARTLAQLAALRARHEFAQGPPKAGWDDVMALFRLARHVETDPLMIDQLVGFAIEGMAIQAAAPYLPDAKTGLPELAATLDRLPAGPTFAQMLQVEKRTSADWLVRELRAAEKNKAGSWQDVWKELLGGPSEAGAPAPKVPAAKTLDEAVKMLEDLPPLYEEVAKLTELPWAEFNPRYATFIEKARAANPAAAAFLPAMNHVVAAKRRADARFALFRAAVAVVQGGPDKVKDHKDPFGDGPFDYTATDGGFELKSKLIFRDQPVTLTVGKK